MTVFDAIREFLARAHVPSDPMAFATVHTLIMARMAAALPFIPFFGGETVPGNVQIGWVILVSFVLYPAMWPSIEAQGVPGFPLYLALLLKETLIGALIGIMTQIVFSAVEAAGALIEFAAGLKPGEILAPQTPTATGPVAKLLGQTAVVLYLSAGIHLVFIASLADSYSILPLLKFPAISSRPEALALAELAGRIAGGFLTVAFQLSAPTVLIVVLIQVGSGLVLRITSIRDDPFQTLRSLAVCGVLFVSAGLLSEEILRQSGSYLGQVRTFLQTLQPR
jgi:hypothetical protein